jgi:bifunctional non-homologous end joining protein LigD
MATAIAPMHPTSGEQPFHHEGWLYEKKVDGYRVLAYKAGERIRLISRHAKDLTPGFPELAAAVASLAPETLVLDGEEAVYDEQLVSTVSLLVGGYSASLAADDKKLTPQQEKEKGLREA